MAFQSAEGALVTVMKLLSMKTLATPPILNSAPARGFDDASAAESNVLLPLSITVRSRVIFMLFGFGVGVIDTFTLIVGHFSLPSQIGQVRYA